jgi:peptidoglycan/xylan/chitin deacetylase (PgdA/CDA1 family)
VSAWLDPLRRALDAAPQPRVFFFRDDDVGRGNDRLPPFLDLFAEQGLPLDLAVIPMDLTPQAARTLRVHAEAAPGRVGLHQHGLFHVNHEPSGRKCEFGPARPADVQRADIAAGRRRLAETLGGLVQPIFTPPWNRCTEATGRVLRDLGFRALSRDATAPVLGLPGLRELPIQADWLARHKGGERVGRAEIAVRLAPSHGSAPMGVMFHHAVMDGAERAAVAELLALLAHHARVRCAPMMQLLAADGAWADGARAEGDEARP